jgi:putative Holliday junction resolvase
VAIIGEFATDTADAPFSPLKLPPSSTSASGRIAGIDFGTVRLGIALSDARRTIASPYENYTRRSPQADAERLRLLVAEEQVALFVVGLPVHLDGRESQKSREARQFGVWLQEATGVPVEYFDERFTSAEAERFLGAAELTKKKRKARLDMLAAQIMLTAYLESTGGHTAPAGLDD